MTPIIRDRAHISFLTYVIKKIGALSLIMVLAPAVAVAGVLRIEVSTRADVNASGRIAIVNTVANSGEGAVQHVTVTSFLGSDARHSPVLGEIAPGASLTSTCEFDGTALKPGRYILISRANLNDRGGVLHNAYDFTPLALGGVAGGPGGAKGEAPAPAVTMTTLSTPLNLKSPLGRKGKMRLALKNNSTTEVEAVVFFALPPTLRVEDGEMRLRLAPGKEKTVDVPFRVQAASAGEVPYTLVAHYEGDGRVQAVQTRGTVRLEERPVLFKLCTLLGVLAILLAALFFWWRKGER